MKRSLFFWAQVLNYNDISPPVSASDDTNDTNDTNDQNDQRLGAICLAADGWDVLGVGR